MPMKSLLLKQEIEKKRTSLKEVLESAKPLEQRSEELLKRADTVQNEEEKEAFEKDLSLFKEEYEKLETLQKQKEDLEKEIEELEEKLKTEEEEQQKKQEQGEDKTLPAERKEIYPMENRGNFGGLTREIVQNTEVQELLSNVRKMGRRDAGIQNVQLTIPETMLELIRQKITEFSKMLKHTRLISLKGKGRERIVGEASEAVWTEMCASTNELTFGFHDVEVDGFMVSGFFAICNAILEDNDVNLTSEIIKALGKSIGTALDRAILFGEGNRMPLGMVTRLAQTAEPSGYSKTARKWVDLSNSNIVTINATDSKGSKLFASLLEKSSAMDNDYDDGKFFWAMNKKTYNYLRAQALAFNSSGVIVAKVEEEMPIIGGKIEIVSKKIIEDNQIVAGYDGLYTVAERAGMKISQSEHVRFLENQTLIKGVARYDGLPVIPEGFMMIGINGETPKTTSEFSPDKANKKEDGAANDGGANDGGAGDGE